MNDDLGAVFRRLIKTSGPISVSRYMGESNAHYYARRDPLGTAGDFVTAPEISQMFGEIIGLWCADLWTRAGRPERTIFVELGPGRGTLASDALRAMRARSLSPQVHFVEGSRALAGLQRDAVPGAHMHGSLAEVPDDAPILLIANEFLDALPIRQLVRTPKGWRERMIGLDEHDRFVFVAGKQTMDDAVPPERRDAHEGAIIEVNPAAAAITQEIADRLVRQSGAALFVDYGAAAPWFGSTLQAVRAHRKVAVLEAPGLADLTAHLDFAALVETTRKSDGPRPQVSIASQGAFLEGLGITARANALAAAQPGRRKQFASDHRRLCAPDEMGELFKVMALVSPDWPEPEGFGSGPIL